MVAPLAGRVLGPMGWAAGTLLEREIDRWRSRHPDTTITMIRPDRKIAGMIGLSPLSLFDAECADAIHPLAVAQGSQWGERLQEGRSA